MEAKTYSDEWVQWFVDNPQPLVGVGLYHLAVEVQASRKKLAEARGLLEYALHLCVNGERAPGGDETWAEFARNTETYLRAILDGTT